MRNLYEGIEIGISFHHAPEGMAKLIDPASTRLRAPLSTEHPAAGDLANKSGWLPVISTIACQNFFSKVHFKLSRVG